VPLFLSLVFLMGVGPLIAWRRASLENLRRNFLWPVALGIVAAAAAFALGVRSLLAALTFATTVFVAVTIGLDFTRATRARVRLGESILPAMGGLLLRHNRRYGGFIVHLGILIIALGVMGSHACRCRPRPPCIAARRPSSPGTAFASTASRGRESNHFKVIGAFTVSMARCSVC